MEESETPESPGGQEPGLGQARYLGGADRVVEEGGILDQS